MPQDGCVAFTHNLSCFFNLLAQLSATIPLLHLPRLLGKHCPVMYLWICSTTLCHFFRSWLLYQAGMGQRRNPAQAPKCWKVVAVGPQGSCLGAWPKEFEGPWDKPPCISKQLHKLGKCSSQAEKALVPGLIQLINRSCSLLDLQVR